MSIKNILIPIVKIPHSLLKNIVFILMLYLYVFRGIFSWLSRRRLIAWMGFKWVVKGINWLLEKLNGKDDGTVSKEYLIELAFRNMQMKKNRTIVTIGGMALGVGAIVFLVSVGYGLERMVISKVTKLNELKMADITSGQVGNLQMNEESRNKIAEVENVDAVIPLVSMVSKVKYNGSVVDVMSMGVEAKYIEVVAPNFVAGDKFVDRDVDFSYTGEGEKILGASSLQELKNMNVEGVVRFRIPKDKIVSVWESCETQSQFLGYAVDMNEEMVGERKWGEKYYSEIKDESQQYSSWVLGMLPLWKRGKETLLVPVLDDLGQQVRKNVCIMEKDVEIVPEKKGSAAEVLGISEEASATAETAEEASVSANYKLVKDESGKEWIEYAQSEESNEKIPEVSFQGSPAAEAYISSGMLRLMGLSEAKEAIGKQLQVSYIITDGAVAGVNGRTQSVETTYTVKGVVEQNDSSFYYFHLADAKRLGIKNYSQMTVVTKNKESLSTVRKAIEGMGFKTTSAADTVSQIESIFENLRLLLGLLGTIALAVASLGMFNTMTVSLLERTREVGVMKSIGMLSNEVKELFLAESLIMGIGGGTFGVLLGFVSGKLLSLILTSISMIKGQGALDVSYVPWFFVAFIIVVSFVVGILTGWYPSKRARQISALNALRYE